METQWMSKSLCQQVGLVFFFPEKGDVAKVRSAKSICASCEVVAECLEFGLEEQHGIWGGTTETERRQIRRQRQMNRKTVAA